MADKPGEAGQTEKPAAKRQQNNAEPSNNPLTALLKFLNDVFRSIVSTAQSLIFLVLNTLKTLLPSAAFTSGQDDTYNEELIRRISEIVDGMDDLKDDHKRVIKENWLDQLEWTNNRATRERDANELIRWWQIILGILIPVLTNGTNPEIMGVNRYTLVSIIGIFVAVLTAIAQFRRPEERWRHYRMITEGYLREMWAFITLSSEIYQNKDERPMTHNEAFRTFDRRMTKIRQEDLAKFFGEVVADNNNQPGIGPTGRVNQEDLAALYSPEFQAFLRQRQGGDNPLSGERT